MKHLVIWLRCESINFIVKSQNNFQPLPHNDTASDSARDTWPEIDTVYVCPQVADSGRVFGKIPLLQSEES